MYFFFFFISLKFDWTGAAMLGITLLNKARLFDSIYPNPWLAYPMFYALVYILSSCISLLKSRPWP